MDSKIDFVIIWVDGNDPEWQQEMRKYSLEKNTDSRPIRYRDWENLKYWFRGVEKFAPWVNNVYFVTCGHLPSWLNVNNPKLKIIKHSDFIPEKYLPTFSSIPIELNLHRIEGLSEQFVYFNDDMFITNNVKPTDFFKDGKPVDMGVFNPITADDKTYIANVYNDMYLINKHFKLKKILKKHFTKYINIKYGKYNIRSLLCLPWSKILGFYEAHNANSYLKKTFDTVWEMEYDALDSSSIHKFRSPEDVNQYIFKYWQYCTGEFYPKKNIKQSYRIFDDINRACCAISNQKFKLLCLNDSSSDNSFEETKKLIIESFEKILPEKSSFENN